jgi:hypothetical protein
LAFNSPPQGGLPVLVRFCRLAVLPGTDHMMLMKRAAWLIPMVSEFLDAAIPEGE